MAGRTGRFAAAALAACSVLAVSAASASAQETFTFEEGKINLGEQKGLSLIDPAVPDPPATLTGTVAGTDFTAPATGFVFPDKTLENIDAGLLVVDALVEFESLVPISGTYDSPTGVLDIDTLDIKATLTVYPDGGSPSSPLGVCTVTPIPLPLSTSGEIVDDVTDPANPVTYAASPFDPDGAVVATWAALPNVTPDANFVCDSVEDLLAGPGGIWLSDSNVTPPDTCATNPALCPVTPPPPLATCANTPSLCPAPPATAKKCKKGFKKKGKKCVKAKKKKK